MPAILGWRSTVPRELAVICDAVGKTLPWASAWYSATHACDQPNWAYWPQSARHRSWSISAPGWLFWQRETKLPTWATLIPATRSSIAIHTPWLARSWRRVAFHSYSG